MWDGIGKFIKSDKEYIYNITHNVDKPFNPFGDYGNCKYFYYLGSVAAGYYTFNMGFWGSEECSVNDIVKMAE